MIAISIILALICSFTLQDGLYKENFRPQYHVTSPYGRDSYPDGLSYYKGTYYFYHQVYYNSTLLKSVYWAHLQSKDLISWKEYVNEVALYPDKQGLPFSGCTVIDKNNDAGFKEKKDDPDVFVSFFTRHNASVDVEKCKGCNTQEIWYSLDKGFTYKPYKYNPVIRKPQAKNYATFIDPLARRNGKKWLTPIAVNSSVEFWQSNDLKHWHYLSSFGPDEGAQGSYWECPDFLQFKMNGTSVWVLIVSVINGGPNVGGGTQYFVGTFDGKEFTNSNDPHTVLWLDYGPDFYCFKGWQNTPQKYYFGIALVSNDDYEDDIPTSPWRGAYTVPRNLTLYESNCGYELATYPISPIRKLKMQKIVDVIPKKPYYFQAPLKSSQYYVKTEITLQDNILIRYYNKQYYLDIIIQKSGIILVDRSHSGIFVNDAFKQIITVERSTDSSVITIEIFVDHSIAEYFIDGGQTSFTIQVFPDPPYDTFFIKSQQKRSVIQYVKMYQYGSIYKSKKKDESDDSEESRFVDKTDENNQVSNYDGIKVDNLVFGTDDLNYQSDDQDIQSDDLDYQSDDIDDNPFQDDVILE